MSLGSIPRAAVVVAVGVCAATAGLLLAFLAGAQGRDARLELTGRVLSGAEPVPDFWLEFQKPDGLGHERPIVVRTDEQGAYRVSLQSPGRYKVGFRPLQYLPVGLIEFEISEQDRVVDFRIPETSLRITLEGQTQLSQPWQVHLFDVSHRQNPAAEFSGFAFARELSRGVRGLALARWRVYFDSPPDLVSAEHVDVDFGASPQVHALVRTRRGGSGVRVLTEEGGPIEGARVSVGTRHFTSDAQGRVRLVRVAPGLPLIIRRDGFAPACVLAPGGDQTIEQMLRPSSRKPVELNLGPENRWPFGTLRSSGDQCELPSRVFDSIVLAKSPDSVSVRLDGFANDEYVFVPSPRWTDSVVLSPGQTRTIIAQRGCAACGSDYPVGISRVPQGR
jgi:hypothetical protein